MWNFILGVIVYTIVCFLLFTVVYAGIGMEENFDIGKTKANNLEHAAWHAWSVQTTSMDDISPTTIKGRIVQACQLALAYTPTLILLSPWNVVSS